MFDEKLYIYVYHDFVDRVIICYAMILQQRLRADGAFRGRGGGVIFKHFITLISLDYLILSDKFETVCSGLQFTAVPWAPAGIFLIIICHVCFYFQERWQKRKEQTNANQGVDQSTTCADDVTARGPDSKSDIAPPKSKTSKKFKEPKQRLRRSRNSARHGTARVRWLKPEHPNARHECVVCGRKYTSAHSLKTHVQTVHAPDDARPPCGICGKRFSDKYQVYRHMQTMHNTGEPEHKCTLCDKKFFRADTLKHHCRVVHKVDAKVFSCDVCSDLFKSITDLKKHLATVHEFSDVKTYQCEVCGKEFGQSSILYFHLRTIHCVGDVKTFSCDVCPKIFRGKGDLKKHLARVHGVGDVKTFQCDVCAKIFRGSDGLKTHLSAVHGIGDVNSHTCDACSKVFTHKSSYRRHLRNIHGASKLGKNFTQNVGVDDG